MSSTEKGGGVNLLDNIKPMPDSIKYGLMGLLALVLIILWFIFSSQDSKEGNAQSLVDIENPVQNLKLEIDSQVPVSRTIKPFAENKQDTRLTDESDLPFASPPQENELKLTKLEDQLNQSILENDVRQQDQDQLITQLQDQLTAQKIQIEQLQTKLKAHQLAVKVKKKSKPYKKTRPRFTLVSIDQWGNDIYIVIRSQGQLHELTNGQAFNGWQVYSVDRLRRAVMFKNKAGARRELSVKL